MNTPLATLAIAEFHQRKASVDAAVKAGRYRRGEGERLLGLWLAIALEAGAPPGECAAVIGFWQDDCGYSDGMARHILLRDAPPRAAWEAELARARAAAGAKARAHPTEITLQLRHAALDCLAIYLGVGPEQPLKEAA